MTRWTCLWLEIGRILPLHGSSSRKRFGTGFVSPIARAGESRRLAHLPASRLCLVFCSKGSLLQQAVVHPLPSEARTIPMIAVSSGQTWKKEARPTRSSRSRTHTFQTGRPNALVMETARAATGSCERTLSSCTSSASVSFNQLFFFFRILTHRKLRTKNLSSSSILASASTSAIQPLARSKKPTTRTSPKVRQAIAVRLNRRCKPWRRQQRLQARARCSRFFLRKPQRDTSQKQPKTRRWHLTPTISLTKAL
jgi:hypothetical protein